MPPKFKAVFPLRWPASTLSTLLSSTPDQTPGLARPAARLLARPRLVPGPALAKAFAHHPDAGRGAGSGSSPSEWRDGPMAARFQSSCFGNRHSRGEKTSYLLRCRRYPVVLRRKYRCVLALYAGLIPSLLSRRRRVTLRPRSKRLPWPRRSRPRLKSSEDVVGGLGSPR